MGSDEFEVQIKRRSIVTPQLLDLDDEDDKIVGLSEDDSEDEDEAEKRRQRIRARAQEEDDDIVEVKPERNNVQEKYITQPDESDSESSEWETDSDAEEEEFNAYKESLKANAPVFVSKKGRVTIVEEDEEEEVDEESLKLQRAEETKAFLKDAIKITMEDDGNNGESDEEGDPKEEYSKWKEREIARIIRDFLERNPEYSLETEKEDNNDGTKKKERKKMKFMQKYYHKGAFYQDDETVKSRDVTAPTLEDKMDISILPKVMQVKNFGKSGRTKYTHLADVDTTDRSSGWGESGQKKRKRGNNSIDDRPKKYSRHD